MAGSEFTSLLDSRTARVWSSTTWNIDRIETGSARSGTDSSGGLLPWTAIEKSFGQSTRPSAILPGAAMRGQSACAFSIPIDPIKRGRTTRPAQFAAPVSACLSIVLLWAVVGCHSTKAGQGVRGAGQQLDFNQDVQPILPATASVATGLTRRCARRAPAGSGRSAFHKRPGHPMRSSAESGAERTDQAHRVKGPTPPDAAVAARRSQTDEGRGHCSPA